MPSSRFHRPAARRVVMPLVAIALLAALALPRSGHADPSDWPRQFDSASGAFVIYQPQPEALEGDQLTARAAFSLQKPAAQPVFGVLWFTTRVEVDRDSSTVVERDLDVTKVRLPQITTDEASRYEKLVEREAARWDLSGSLEELRAGLAAAEKERANVEDLNNDPPRILFTNRRAILLVYDGTPVLQPIEDSNLEYVANTPYAVVYDPSRRTYYLSGANVAYTARNPLGPWSPVSQLPAAVRDVMPPDTAAVDQLQGAPPQVITATEPTELIATDGPPQYAPLVGDELLYVTNTESDVLRDVSTQTLYVLLAGRWFTAPSQDGPWSYVRGDELPPVFSRIRPDSPKGHLLASIAGTEEAEDAVADAEIPQTSAVRREGTDFAVSYDGEPEFEPISGTDLQYAVNTDAEVIFADGHYYACDQGVWYIADDPDGPWRVSETMPLGLEDIPPSCPVYDVRYVYIYSYTPEVVYVGYLPGYLGCYPYHGTVVYGTGWHYRPWRGRHHFYPRAHTWGFQPRYNPWLSRWSFGYSYGTGFLRVGSRWHPQRMQPLRPLWFGPGGYRRPLIARDLTLQRTRTRPPIGRLRPPDLLPANLYNRQENVRRVDRAALRMPLRPVVAPRPAPLPNNMFAGKDGRVYQRDPGGGWKVNEGPAWRPTPLPMAPRTRPSTPPVVTPRRWPRSEPLPRPTPVESPAQAPPAPAARPIVRPAPAPVPAQPADRPVERRVFPQSRPASAPVSSSPGNLERVFRARERAEQAPRVSAPPPQPPRVSAPPPPPAKPLPPRVLPGRNEGEKKEKKEG